MPLHMIEGVTIPVDFKLPDAMTPEQKREDDKLFDEALALLKEKNAFLIAHYYTNDTMQRLAEESGGFIGDSLEMARVGRDSDKNLIVVAGVRFMGETAKILSPHKQVLMPDLEAECSLDLCCSVDDFVAMKNKYPNATTVAYANTSAKVKAKADWIVTSSLAVELAEYLKSRKEEILWVPDRHLGSYIAKNSEAMVHCWPGRCIVHDAFESNALAFVLKENPNAKILVHPEAPESVVAMADFVGSTSQILDYAKKSSSDTFIIATERNIFYKIKQACPDKKLIEAPVASLNGHCISCANCPWMGLNSLAKLIKILKDPKGHEIFVDEDIRVDAIKPLDRMLRFSAALKSGNEIPKDL